MVTILNIALISNKLAARSIHLSFPPLTGARHRQIQSNITSHQDIIIPEEHLGMKIDLRQFINLSPYTCNESVSFARIFNLFRSMGLRLRIYCFIFILRFTLKFPAKLNSSEMDGCNFSVYSAIRGFYKDSLKYLFKYLFLRPLNTFFKYSSCAPDRRDCNL